MKKRSTPYTDERLAREGLRSYLDYMKRRGLTDPRESVWTQKIAQALGLPLKPPKPVEPRDAYEEPAPAEIVAPGPTSDA